MCDRPGMYMYLCGCEQRGSIVGCVCERWMCDRGALLWGVCDHRCRKLGTGGAPGACVPPPSFHKLLYKLLTTLCVVSNCAPPIKKSFLRLWH